MKILVLTNECETCIGITQEMMLRQSVYNGPKLRKDTATQEMSDWWLNRGGTDK